MKKIITLFSLVSLAAIAFLFQSYSSGNFSQLGDRTGRPGAGNCAGCHSGSTAFGTVSTSIQLLSGGSPVTSYVGGNTYTVQYTVNNTSGSPSYAGQMVGVLVSNTTTNAGSMTSPSANAQVTTSGGRTYLSHSGTSSAATFSATWTAPAVGAGSVRFYASGLAVNGNGGNGSGDQWAGVNATFTEVQPLTTSPNSYNISCSGVNDGAIALNATGGATPYTYNWTGTNQTTDSISGLSAGNYSATVTDAGGATVTGSFTLTSPSAITGSVSISSPIQCNGGNGTLSITPSGGTAPYSYAWQGLGGTNSTQVVTAGFYAVSVTDANGCMLLDTITVVQPQAISLNFASQATSCKGGNDGLSIVSVQNGTGVFTYNWSNAATTSSVTNLSAGTYTVTITDQNGCSSVDSTVITEPSAMIISLASSTQASCAASNGSLTAMASNGTTPYSYVWDNGTNNATNSSIAAGNYTVVVTDGNGCQDSAIFTVTNSAAPTISLAGTNVSCFGGNSGAISATISGGAAPYTYSWNNGFINPNITTLTAGVYILTLTDNNSCIVLDTIQITEPSAIVPSVSSDTVSCSGSSDGILNATASGGVGGFTFNWSNGQSGNSIVGLLAGQYLVTVTDMNSCTAVDSGRVGSPIPIATNTTIANNGCAGDTIGNIKLTVSGGAGGFNIIWNNGATGDSISGLDAGVYVYTVTDNNGCATVDSAQIINQFPLPTFSFTSDTLVVNDGVILDASSANALGYQWTSGETSSAITVFGSGWYGVTITNANGCSVSDSVFVDVILGIDLTNLKDLSIYPTPADGFLNIASSSLINSVEFYGLNGSVIKRVIADSKDLQVELTTFQSGTYLLKVTQQDGTSVYRKLLVQH